MFKDIITYELDDGVDEQHLLKIAREIIESWMSKQVGFIQWDIHKDAIGEGYTNIVYWETREAAQKADRR